MTVELGDLRRDWPWVRPGLEAIKERQDEDWLPEDIYCLVKSGRASLYVAEGFFAVLQPVNDSITGAQGAFILACYNDTQEYEPTLAELEEIARQAGCVYLEMGSKRKGFSRRGFEPVCTIYRRRI